MTAFHIDYYQQVQNANNLNILHENLKSSLKKLNNALDRAKQASIEFEQHFQNLEELASEADDIAAEMAEELEVF